MVSILCGLLGGCGNDPASNTQEISVRFTAVAGDAPVRCGAPVVGIGTTSATVELLDLRLYVSNLRMIDETGADTSVELAQDGRWQVENVALLDFEDGSGKCANGNADLNNEVTGTVPAGTYTGVAFDVAVPFELNHGDVAAAPAPLNVSAMFWAWAIGHKFVRVDLETPDGLGWNMHLGSTMCTSDGPMDPPGVECARPNRPTVTLASFDSEVDTVTFDIAALFANADLSRDTADTASGCQTFPDDVNECTPLFPNLGLDFATGMCIDGCAGQTVFGVQ
jgi:uncharacterized repeat protein (TIGR04052 family)